MMSLGFGLGLSQLIGTGEGIVISSWILDTGVWNDSGQWDDSDTWNDGA